ncbi:NYN domain-containing protein, partial [Veillonella parvula]|nr:NYN domain-containing protein [Veillonella parvula]
MIDAYKVKGNAGKRETFHNIEVVYTKQDETADAFIEKTVFGIRDRYKVTVATSDGLEQQTVMSLGARFVISICSLSSRADIRSAPRLMTVCCSSPS